MRYGFYSQEAVDFGCGTIAWEAADGREVIVTCVCNDEAGTGYGWKDKVCVGPVVRFLRQLAPCASWLSLPPLTFFEPKITFKPHFNFAPIVPKVSHADLAMIDMLAAEISAEFMRPRLSGVIRISEKRIAEILGNRHEGD